MKSIRSRLLIFIVYHCFTTVLGGVEGPVCEGLTQAYNSAESLRAWLVQQRQRLAAETDGQIPENNDPGKC